MPPFYITTPIYYVNALPHLGTFYSTVVADALARYHRARGDRTFFLTGLDEHGLKIQRIAEERGLKPQVYADGIADKFRETWQRMEISNDRFIRTTDPDHHAAVAEMWRRMRAKGDIYPAEYDGLYCVGCEESKTEDEVVIEGGEKLCPIHRKPVEKVKEKNYFFNLKKYAPYLLDLYKRPDFIRPESRRNEVASFVASGLRDISVSRLKKSVGWGIPVPDDPDHVVYVWVDALINYVTALGGPEAVARGDSDGDGALWAGAHHLIAKDILRFHAVYWPAMLESAGLPPPKGIFCHGYLTVKGQKISKSIPATRVDPNAIVAELGDTFVDPLRYFVLREYTLGGDGDFTYESLFQRYESDLGNDLGNLLNRTISMAHRYVEGKVDRFAPDPNALPFKLEAEAAWADFAPSRALEATWKLVRATNQYIEKSAPWALAKSPEYRPGLLDVLGRCLEALRWSALMIAPAMPNVANEILRQLGREEDAGTWPETWAWPGGNLTQPKPIFPRIEPERQASLIAKWMPAEAPLSPTSASASASTSGAPVAASPPAEIAIDDFAKIDLRVAKVVAAERVAKSDKLLKLTLDVGGEPRTVVSGIAAAYQPEQLVGRTVIYLANLKPAKICGVVSQGMILAAGDADVLALSALDREVPPGTRVR
jgi:methionyl-tRNA synthetase